jgi:hypothetical protein
MSSISKVSFVKRALSVLTASMFLLSGVVLTTAPASAATTETVPYTYTVKVPVTKTVREWVPTKVKIGNRTITTYTLVEKTKTEYRIETRTGYREAPVKAADKPAAAEYKVQVATTAAFTNVTKEIIVTPSAPGTNKVNLSSQLSGSVGDTTYVRVVAKNAAGKSTPGKAAKLTFGEVSRSNYDVQVPYTATGTRQATAGYWYSYTDYNSPTYGWVYGQTGGGYYEQQATGGYWTSTQTGGGYYTWGQTAPATSGSYWVSGYYESYWVSGYNESYTYEESYSSTCYYVPGYSWSAYSCTKYRTKTGTRWVSGYNAQRWVSGYTQYYSYPATYGTVYVEPTYTSSYVTTYGMVYVEPTYGNVWSHTGYNSASAYAQPTYENYTYTAYTTETRVAITNGWKAATN